MAWQVTLPDAKQLRLSEDAVLHMRRIVDEFSYATGDNTSRGSTKQRLHQLLFDFFDTFGSHVFRRPACGAQQLTAHQGHSSPGTPSPARGKPRAALHDGRKTHKWRGVTVLLIAH